MTLNVKIVKTLVKHVNISQKTVFNVLTLSNFYIKDNVWINARKDFSTL